MLLPPLPEKLHGSFEEFDAPCETLHELCKASNVQPEAIDRLLTELWEFCEDNYVLLLELSEKPRVILVCKAAHPHGRGGHRRKDGGHVHGDGGL